MTSEVFTFDGKRYAVAPAVCRYVQPYPPRNDLCIGCARGNMDRSIPICDALRSSSRLTTGLGGCNFATFNGMVFVEDTETGWEFYLRAKLSGDDNVKL